MRRNDIMNAEFSLKKRFKITMIGWLIFFILCPVITYFFISYRPDVEPYLQWWYPLVLVPIIYGIELYLYKKNKIRVMSDHILFPRPYTRTKNGKLNYEGIEKIAVKFDTDMEYLYSIIDQENHEYKISNLTGDETAYEILKVIKKFIDEQDLDVEIVEA